MVHLVTHPSTAIRLTCMLRPFLFAGLCSLLLATPLTAQHTTLQKGDRQYDRENYKAAEQNYLQATTEAPNNTTATYNLGNTRYQQGKWEDAEQNFTEAVQSAPNPGTKADALHNLGNALLKQHKYAAAITAYESSLLLRPGDTATKQNLQMARKKAQEEAAQKPPPPQNQQDQPPQQAQQQAADKPPTEPQSPQPTPQQPAKTPDQRPQEQPSQPSIDRQQAEQLLKNVVGPDDQRNARKYRQSQIGPKKRRSSKDW